MEKREGMIIILIVLIILIVSAIIFLLITKKDEIKKKIAEIKENLFEKNTSENQKQNEVPQTETNAGGGGDGSSGSAGGGGTTQTENSDCLEKQISYSMMNPNKTSICNEHQGQICVDKTIICSIQIKNMDYESGGIFKIEITFVERDLNKESGFYSGSSEYYVDPRTSQIFEASTTIQSTGEEGIANKDINCFYTTIEVPKKEIC